MSDAVDKMRALAASMQAEVQKCAQYCVDMISAELPGATALVLVIPSETGRGAWHTNMPRAQLLEVLESIRKSSDEAFAEKPSVPENLQ